METLEKLEQCQAILFETQAVIKSLAVIFQHLENFEIKGNDLAGIGVIMEFILKRHEEVEKYLE